MGHRLACTLALCVAATAGAATVDFDNGDRLTGEIVSLFQGRVILRTEQAGEVAARWERVASLASAEPLRLHLSSGETLEGSVERLEGGWLALRDASGAVRTVALPMVAGINVAPGSAPPPAGLGSRTGGSPIRVTLRNGDRVSGDAVAFRDGRLLLDTPHAGEIAASWDDVASLASSVPISLHLGSGDVLEGPVTDLDGGWLGVRTGEGTRTVAMPMIAGINEAPRDPVAAAAPASPRTAPAGAAPDAWGGHADWHALVAWGASDVGASASLGLWRETSAGRLSGTFSALYGRDGAGGAGGEERLSLRLDRELPAGLYAFGALHTEHDDREDLALRASFAPGVGRTLWRGATGVLEGEVGLAATRRDLDGAASDTDLELHAALRGQLALPAGFTGRAVVTVASALDEGGDVRLASSAILERPLARGMRLSAGALAQLDSRAPAGVDGTDLQLRAGLAIVF